MSDRSILAGALDWAAAIELALETGNARTALADLLDEQAAAHSNSGADCAHPEWAESYFERARDLRATAARIRSGS